MTDSAPAIDIAASGLRAQSARMRILAENLANAGSTARTPGGDPYQRQIPIFDSILDRETGINHVRLTDTAPDRSDFGMRFEPGHPAADENGYVKTSNVNGLIEMVDMREAQRAFEANLSVLETSRTLLMRTLDLLRK